MKVRCGRCGAEYSEIRRICPKCSEDTRYAVYIEGSAQGRTIFDVNSQNGVRQQCEQVEQVQEVQQSIEDVPDMELEDTEVTVQPMRTEELIYTIYEEDKTKIINKVQIRQKRRPFFMIVFFLGLVFIVGAQMFENYRQDYQVMSRTKEIPVEKIQVNQQVDLGDNSFVILGVQEVENDVINKYVPQDKKILAVEIKAIEEKYTDETRDLYTSAFYGYYKEDEYTECIQNSSIIALLELEGYLPYYGPSAYDESSYMFFLVDQDVAEMTLVYTLQNKSFMRGEYIEKLYDIKLKIK